MIESVSLVRQIQTDPGGPSYDAQINRLSAVAENLSLPELIPLDPKATRATERDALIRYVSGLREAVKAGQTGHDQYAQQALGTIVTPEVFAGLSSLDTHWDCSAAESPSAGGENASTSRDGSAFRGSEGGTADGSSSRPSNPAQASANSRNNPTTTGEGKGSYFARNAVVTANTLAFFVMLIGLALFGGLFWLNRRARQETVREARRVLDIPVQVSLAGHSHPMRLVDISMNGFKLRHFNGMTIDGDIKIQLGPDWHTGQVRWSNPHFAGVKFKRPLDQDLLSDILSQTRAEPEMVTA
jgi:hypothetical protein